MHGPSSSFGHVPSPAPSGPGPAPGHATPGHSTSELASSASKSAMRDPSPVSHPPPPYVNPPPALNGVHPAERTGPPARPVFGLSLEELFARDGSAVPMVVYQCLQAIDLFGLEVEGIYRLSGTATHITKLRTIFDHGSSWRALVRVSVH